MSSCRPRQLPSPAARGRRHSPNHPPLPSLLVRLLIFKVPCSLILSNLLTPLPPVVMPVKFGLPVGFVGLVLLLE